TATTVDVADLTITVGGGGGNTINAQTLADGHVLNLVGSDAATVNLTAGDLVGGASYTGVLTVNVVTNSSTADTVSVTTGTNTTSITAADADTIAVNATALADNT